jgi:UDP-N-acetyl-D-glucosamine/UDP-N-acetyl-D-galactosamine dehydrogenase
MHELPSLTKFLDHTERIAVVGLGYVGLPLAVHLARHFAVVGFDIKRSRIEELLAGLDRTCEVSSPELASPGLHLTGDEEALSRCRLIIVAVPTPIDNARIPDLEALCSASAITGRHLQKGSCVVYESTVYPGVTEEVCVPILERQSGFRLGRDFSVGYSPERINPGDKVHSLDKIKKIVSASDLPTRDFLAQIYGRVVMAGIYPASSIRVAEAAKVIENTQRDINIALMNELAIIFSRMGIDSLEVLEAAGTKWNFLPFRPGLVGGHCIGVDPYYLTYKAEMLGYHPEVILAGRRINDQMGKYIAERTIKMLITAGKPVKDSRVAVLGLTFKENIPDLRNTRVVDIINELRDYGVRVLVHDPLADPAEAEHYCGQRPVSLEEMGEVDGVVVAVAHQAYHDLGLHRIASLCGGKNGCPLIDVKGIFCAAEAASMGIHYWHL